MATGAGSVDLVNRDPNSINGHLQVAFEDVLGEPEGIRSIDCVWKLAFTCFECWKGLCYKLNTLLCGCCIAACWGVDFATISFAHIWYYTPCLRWCSIECGMCQKFYAVCINCCCEPMCALMGKCVGRVKTG